MEHRSLPQRNKAVLRHRESTSEKGVLPERTHTPITKSVSKAGDKPHHEGNNLVRSKNLHHPRRHKIIPYQPHNSFTTNCVTPIYIKKNTKIEKLFDLFLKMQNITSWKRKP